MPSGGYRNGVESGLRWAYVTMLFLFAISWVVVGLAYRDRVGPGLWAAIGAFVIVALAGGVRSARRQRLATTDVLAMTVVAVLLQVAWANDPQTPFGPGHRTMVTAAVVLGAFVFASGRWRVAAILIAVGAQAVTDAGRLDPLNTVIGLLPVAAAGLAAMVCVPAMREAARRADAAADDQQRSVAQAAAQAGVHRARLESQAVLHDDVVSALRAISLAGVSPQEGQHAARDAVASIERSPMTADDHTPTDLARLVLDLAPVPGTLTTVQARKVVMVPGAVALAAVAAAGEVLRNVARHAHARQVGVRLDRVGEGFALVIHDDGVGFRPEAAMRGRSHGLANSVVARLRNAGGQAEVTSMPGQGTRVRLTWQPAAAAPPRQATRPERMAAAMEDIRRPLAAACLPYLAMTGVFVAQDGFDGHLPWWLLVWIAGLGAITVALLARAHTGLSGPLCAAALGYGVAGTTAALFVLTPQSLHDYSSWPLGAIAPLLALVVIVRPLREAAAWLLIGQAVIVFAALSGHFGGGPWTAQIAAVTPGALSMVQPVILGLVMAQTILRLGDVVTRANAARSATAASGSALRARESVHRGRLAAMNEEILPFLREVAAPLPRPITAGASGIRERARLLEHAARDELHLPGVLDPATRDLLRRARDAGCIITIQSGIADIAFPGLVRDVITAALASSAPPRELTLSIRDTGGFATVSLVTLPGDPVRAAALTAAFRPALTEFESTPEATWAEVSLTAGRSPAPAGDRL